MPQANEQDKELILQVNEAVRVLLEALKANKIPRTVAKQSLLNLAALMIAGDTTGRHDKELLEDFQNSLNHFRKGVFKKNSQRRSPE